MLEGLAVDDGERQITSMETNGQDDRRRNAMDVERGLTSSATATTQSLKEANASRHFGSVLSLPRSLTPLLMSLRQAGGPKTAQETIDSPPDPSTSDIQHFHTPEEEAGKPEPKQSCFLCLRGRRPIHYAIRIPCSRPGLGPRHVKEGRSLKRERRGYYEKDSAIYERMLAACYQFHGNWKRWIPFYGIVDVREVQVRSSSSNIRLAVLRQNSSLTSALQLISPIVSKLSQYHLYSMTS